jgi:hypothetical protein
MPNTTGDKRGLAKVAAFLIEIFFRFRAAFIILLWGDIVNGNIKRLKRALDEIDYIVSHVDDMSKAEIVDLLSASDISKANTGVRHNIAHVLISQAGWRFFLAQRREAEWHYFRQSARRQKERDSLQVILQTVEDDFLEDTLSLLELDRIRKIAKIVSQAITSKTVTK